MTPGAATAAAGAGAAYASGPLHFACYAYPPNSLGYCGPADPEEMRGAVTSRDAATVARLAGEFSGAWPYLQLIAGCNGIQDPLDRRVTQAYWLGNSLLERIPPRVLATWLHERFAGLAAGDFPLLAETAFTGGLAHHNFHVFAVSPWIGMLRSGKAQPALSMLDRCRIRWGRIETAGSGAVTVRTRPLCLTGSKIHLGRDRLETARCHQGDADAAGWHAAALAPGDWVSLHWDWVCERLSPHALRRLRAYTARNLEAVNKSIAPGPAVAADARGG